ncbi:hypothetical protein IQ07DRAFT_108148 [Pyrenochaeta sp. DS3sAY3a]|nr:hypothetical protein IQ07DRAFT_108148 [Pyrenochaeta sp. DS3sAY3a]
MIVVAPSFNMVCSCTQCTSFLIPPQPPKYSPKWSTWPTNTVGPSISSRVGTLPPPIKTCFPPTSRLGAVSCLWSTSSPCPKSTILPRRSTASISPTGAFARTPGGLRCTHIACTSRIPATSRLSMRSSLLCERHGKELRSSVKIMVDSWSVRADKRINHRMGSFSAAAAAVERGEAERNPRVGL